MTFKANKDSILPVTLADVQAELELVRDELEVFLNGITKDITESLYRSFVAAGGCSECRGRGWIVTWDTMDSMSGCFAEYGTCMNPECNDETRMKTGLSPHRNKYDNNRGVPDVVKSSPAYKCVAEPIVDRLSEVSIAIRDIELDRRNLIKGDRIVVVRGRKSPVGTMGRVAWVSSNTGGVLLKDEDKWQTRDSSGVWLDPRNVEKLAE